MNQSLLTNPSFNVDGETKNIGHNLDAFSYYTKRGCGGQILESMSLPPATGSIGYEMFFTQKIQTHLEALVKIISTGISAYFFSFLNLSEKTLKNNFVINYSYSCISKHTNIICYPKHLETQVRPKKQKNILLSFFDKREY